MKEMIWIFIVVPFRVHGDTIDVIPASEKAHGIRIELFGDEVDEYIFI